MNDTSQKLVLMTVEIKDWKPCLIPSWKLIKFNRTFLSIVYFAEEFYKRVKRRGMNSWHKLYF